MEGERVGGLHVWLVEARENPFGIGGFKLRVQIHLVINRINEAVQALTRAGVGNLGGDLKFIVCNFQPGKRDAIGRVIRIEGQGIAVEAGLEHIICAEIDKRGTRFFDRKIHGGQRREVFLFTQV